MHPIEIAHTLDQQGVHTRLATRTSPVMGWSLSIPNGTIPSSALASAVAPRGPVPMSPVAPPEVAPIKKRRWRSVWARALQTHRSPIGNV
jgi:hypothetical protein